MNDQNKIIIVGSGLSSLMLARMIRKYRNPDIPILIIEKDATIGGQFTSINYGQNGFFDYGMHIYYESSIPEIDLLFTTIFPDTDWNILIDNEKDIAGIFYNGVLQLGHPYPDLRSLSEEKIKEYAGSILLNAAKHVNQTTKNLTAYGILEAHFGKLVTDEIFVPILEKLYLTEASKLDEIATKLTTINRVALFDEAPMLDLMKSETIRSRICFPDQLKLPAYRTTTQRGFYPKKFGMIHVINKFKSLLESDGVEFLTSASITDLEMDNNSITSIVYSKDSSTVKLSNIAEVYWTAGLVPLALSLKIDISDLKNDKKKTEAVYVNLILDKMPIMGRLYYFYCFDKGFRTFRVTNYSSYCPAANDNRGFPVCVEMWLQESDSRSENDIIEQAKNELSSFGVIDGSFKILFSKVEKPQGGGFPLPSITNISNMGTIRERVASQGIKNLIPTGVLAEKNVFFIKDVLTDSYNKVVNAK